MNNNSLYITAFSMQTKGEAARGEKPKREFFNSAYIADDLNSVKAWADVLFNRLATLPGSNVRILMNSFSIHILRLQRVSIYTEEFHKYKVVRYGNELYVAVPYLVKDYIWMGVQKSV